uniref:TIDP3438 n=1 Tax=Arundo donax TaxID=35708 RepID=A0A0A8YT00_ARUDO
MESDEAGEDAGVGLVRVDEHLLHDIVRVRARAVVVVLA